MCTATLTTVAEIERHENNIYQPGYTPTAIRDNIQRVLRDSNPDQHLVDFQEKDIPPVTRDLRTHRVLSNLLLRRSRIDHDFQLPPESVGSDGNPLDPNSNFEAKKQQRDREYNRINRSMYQVYAASAYLIHDCNFLSYCRPALRNLPAATAYKLATLKAKLQPEVVDAPPYTNVEQKSTVHTKPVFAMPTPTYADVLKPREEWMKNQSPRMIDSDADRTWRQASSSMFGEPSPTNVELQMQIINLQYQLNQRDRKDKQDTPFASRIFRQGRKTNTADEKEKQAANQSETRKNKNYVSSTEKSNESEPKSLLDQSEQTKKPTLQPARDSFLENSGKTIQSSSKEKHDFFDNEDSSSDFEDSHYPQMRVDDGSPPMRLLGPLRDDLATRQDVWTQLRTKAQRRTAGKCKDTAIPKPAPSSKKTKNKNEFGGGTFWNRPPTSERRKTNQGGQALSTNDSPSLVNDLIVDTGASHVLFQQRHMDLLDNIQLSSPSM